MKHQENLTEHFNVGFNDVHTTLLGKAAFTGHSDKVAVAIADGIDWELEYDSPLEGALWNLDSQLSHDLIEAGSPITKNIFYLIYSNNMVDILNEILATKQIIDWTDTDTDQLVVEIVTSRQSRRAGEIILHWLLNAKKANPNQKISQADDGRHIDWPLLNYATYHYRFKTVRELVQAGADLNGLTPGGLSPLYCCAAGRAFYPTAPDDRKKCLDFLQSKNAEFTPTLTWTQKILFYFDKPIATLY